MPDKLLSMRYVIPNMKACTDYGNPPTCDDAEPEGFDGSEDNTNLNAVQQAWHPHPGLGFRAIGFTQAGANEGLTEAGCNA